LNDVHDGTQTLIGLAITLSRCSTPGYLGQCLHSCCMHSCWHGLVTNRGSRRLNLTEDLVVRADFGPAKGLHGKHNGYSSRRRGPGEVTGRCHDHGAPTDASDAQMLGDTGEAYGCAQMQVNVPIRPVQRPGLALTRSLL